MGFQRPHPVADLGGLLLVSIPDGYAWVFKAVSPVAAPVASSVSIPDGDAWVFKAHPNG